MYRGIIQPHKRALMAQRVSILSRSTELTRQNTDESSSATPRWKRNRVQRESSIASIISDGFKSSVSSCDSSACELPQRNTHRRVTFSLTTDLTINEDANETDDNVFDDSIVITHPVVVEEMEMELKKDNLTSDNNAHS